MAESKDNVMNEFMGRPDIFADLFNAWVFHGKKVVKAEKLIPADRLLSEVIGDQPSQTRLIRFRDIFKVYCDDDMTYVMLGIENQSDIHYAMPLRNMIYDALSLLARVRQKQAAHLQNKDLRDAGEFLSRFSRTDRIDPVVSLVVYYGLKPWDGPVSLHEMMHFPNDDLRAFVPNYFINLVTPVIFSEEQLARFDTELCEVFGYIRYAGDKSLLRAFMLHHPRFEALSYDAVRAINACTNANIKITQNKEGTNMCQALIDIRKEGWDEGWDEGRDTVTKEIVLRMHKLTQIPLKDIAACVNLTLEEVQAIIDEAEQAEP